MKYRRSWFPLRSSAHSAFHSCSNARRQARLPRVQRLEHVQRDHGWHMSLIDRLASDLIVQTQRVIVDLAGIGRSATVATLDPHSVNFLGMAMGPGVLVMIAVTIYAASFYGITRAEHRRIGEAISLAASHRRRVTAT